MGGKFDDENLKAGILRQNVFCTCHGAVPMNFQFFGGGVLRDRFGVFKRGLCGRRKSVTARNKHYISNNEPVFEIDDIPRDD